jgi:hypothetical protein
MKRLIPIALFFAVLLAAASSQDPISALLQKALDEISAGYGQNIIAAFGNFTYEYSGMGSSFSRYLEDRLADAIEASPSIDLIVLNALENLDPAFKEVFKDVFKVEQARALIRGRFFDQGGSIRVELEIVSLVDAVLIGRKSINVSKELVPNQVALLPADYEKASKIGQDISQVFDASDGGLVVRAATNRGNGAVYKDGEEMMVYFFANQDTYVKVYSINAIGSTSLIFPNRYHTNNLIHAKTLTVIPDDSYPFRFVITPPFGTEHIKVIASTGQFEDIEAAYVDLGNATKGLLTRGIGVTQRKSGVAEALLTYTAVKE